MLSCCPAAVVGAGIGGTATAYFLRQEFGDSVKIDIFEAGTVGGRLATEMVAGAEYETGGAIIHPLNLHMKHFVDKLGESFRVNSTIVTQPATQILCQIILHMLEGVCNVVFDEQWSIISAKL